MAWWDDIGDQLGSVGRAVGDSARQYWDIWVDSKLDEFSDEQYTTQADSSAIPMRSTGSAEETTATGFPWVKAGVLVGAASVLVGVAALVLRK